LPLELASKDGTSRGGKIRKDKSIGFWLDLKKKGNTLLIVLHFLVNTIKNYIVHSHLAHKKKLEISITTNCQMYTIEQNDPKQLNTLHTT